MKEVKRIVTVFGSGFPKPYDLNYQEAYELGKLLAQEGFTICNGGYGGIMEASARGAKEAGGKTIGILTEMFSKTPNPFIDEAILMKTLNERLMKLIELGDVYVVLRGGTGTLVELATVWEYLNKQIITEKPVVFIGKFWEPVINLINKDLLNEGRKESARYITCVNSPIECVKVLK